MKHAIVILGITTLIAGVIPAVDAKPSQMFFEQGGTKDLYQQGRSLFESGDYKGAIETYNQALQLNTNDSESYIGRALARFAVGDKQGAIDDFTQVIQLNPNNAEAYRQRGGVYLTMGQKKKARADFQRAAEISSTQRRSGQTFQ